MAGNATGTTTVSYTHDVQLKFASSSGSTITADVFIASHEEILGTYTIPAATTNYFINITGILVAKLNDLLMYSANSDVTVKTNSSSAPTNTLTYKAGVPEFWTVLSGRACPLTGDITAGIYVTNASALASPLTIIIGQDPQT